MSSDFYTGSSINPHSPQIQDLRPIHEGLFFEVWKVRIGIKWYIRKGLIKNLRHSALHIELLRKEFEIGQSLSHPNICHYTHLSYESGEWFIWMEYIDGVLLSQILKEPRSYSCNDKRLVLQLSKQIGDALKYIHAKNIYHGDLSPTNIIYDSGKNKFYLIDFGHAHATPFVRVGGGTRPYGAPEALENMSTLEPTADIYSFGKILSSVYKAYGSKKYRLIEHYCCSADPRKRLKDIKSLQKKIIWLNYKTTIYSSLTILCTTILCFILLAKKNSTITSPLKAGSISNPFHRQERNLSIKSDTAKHYHQEISKEASSEPTRVAASELDSMITQHSFLEEFRRQAKPDMTEEALFALRRNLIISHYDSFTKFLERAQMSQALLFNYKQAYSRAYYREFLTSDSIIQALANEQ